MDNFNKSVLLILAFLIVFSSIPTSATSSTEIKAKRLDDRVLILTTGAWKNNMVVFSSSEGLIVVDTFMSQSFAEEAKRIIQKEFSGKRVKFVINTHGHWDHFQGNQVFEGAVKIGHRSILEDMQESEKGRMENIPYIEKRINELETELVKIDSGSDEAQRINHSLDYAKRLLDDFSASYIFTPSSLTFDDRLSLHLGDMNIHLFTFQGAHSASDILIHVPEQKMLLVGDVFGKGWLPSFSATGKVDIDWWFSRLDSILAGHSAIEVIIPSHENMMTRRELETWIDYLKRLWALVSAEEESDKSLEQIQGEFDLKTKFPELNTNADEDKGRIDRHKKNIETFWNITSGNNGFPFLEGPYLGQKPPGLTPEIFAPGIVCDSQTQGYPSFTSDGNEFYFNRRRNGISEFVVMKLQNDTWSAPQIVPYSREYEFWEPSISPDGSKIFFCSKYSDGKIDESNDLDLWIMERHDGIWEKPSHLGPDASTENNEAFPTFSSSGNLYFFRSCKGEQGCDLFVSKFVNGKLERPQNLGPDVNSNKHDCDPAIAFDESCLLFCVRDREDGLGKTDLYISFKKKDGNWTKSVNMGPQVNTEAEEITPHLTADKKFLFFASNRSGNYDIYWISAKVIKKLAAENKD